MPGIIFSFKKKSKKKKIKVLIPKIHDNTDDAK